MSEPKAIKLSGTTWVAGGIDTNPIQYSTNDGSSWSNASPPLTSCYGLVFVDSLSLWIAVGEGGTDSIATSPDGITWT